MEDEEKEQNKVVTEEKTTTTTTQEDEGTSQQTALVKTDDVVEKSRTASHEAFDWLMSPVSGGGRNISTLRKETEKLKENRFIEEEEEEVAM